MIVPPEQGPSHCRPSGWQVGLRVLGGGVLVWLLLYAVRTVWLVRPDPFGQPLVTNLWTYWRRTGALEWLYWAPALAPGLAVAFWQRTRPVSALVENLLRIWLLAAAIVVLTISTVDMEVMRFAGSHLNASLLRTFGNATAVREMAPMLLADHGVPYLGLAMLGVAIAAAGWRLGAGWARTDRLRPRWPRRRLFLSSVALALLWSAAAYALCFPGARWVRWRLAPAAALVLFEWRATNDPPLTVSQQRELARFYQAEWVSGASDSEARRWRFPEPDYPAFRITLQQACALGRAATVGVDCGADQDGDGVSQAVDCDDGDASVHPGAGDVPGDGIDQDCNGTDADPWNLILLILESHRAASVGHLVPWGATTSSATPVLDALAREGRSFTRVSVNGLPSAPAFMCIHTGLEPHPGRQVGTDFTSVRLPSFPALLRDHGYSTRFFSQPPPDWDNLAFWARQWYDDVDHDRRRRDDRAVFDAASTWLKRGRPPRRPFLVTIATGSNHFPFDKVPPGILPAGLDAAGRLRHSMRWVDEEIGRFLDGLRGEPWFRHTVVIVTADHGYPLGEHGSHGIVEHLYGETTWVPLVIAGAHPGIRRGLDHRVASHVDLAPTVLDLAGIDAPNAFSGHSLIREAGAPGAVALLSPEVAYARGDLKIVMGQPGHVREAGDEAFATGQSRMDLIPARAPASELAGLRTAAARRCRLNAWLYDTDRALPPWGQRAPAVARPLPSIGDGTTHAVPPGSPGRTVRSRSASR